MNSPLLSIVILVKDLPQLFPLTIDSILNQSVQDYEIIVIDQIKKEELFDSYSKYIEQFEYIEEPNLGYAMQKGLEKAKGKYIQYLLTGDSYLGINSLENLFVNLTEDVDLIFSSHVKKELDLNSTVELLDFSKRNLTSGILPSKFQCIWFKSEVIKKLGGINPIYKYRPNLDLLSRVFLVRNLKINFLNQVIVDCEMRKKPTTDLLKRFMETYTVIRKNFGYLMALRWFLTQNYIDFVNSLYRALKKIFYRP